MQDNISKILENQVLVEEIDAKAVHLNEEAEKFKSGAKDLSTKMFWKKWKMRLLLGFLITAVLIIIIAPIASTSSSSSSSSSSN